MPEIFIDIDSTGNITNVKDLSGWLRKLKTGKWLLQAKDYRKRSLNQNDYYWAVIVPMCKEALYDVGWEIYSNDECHEFLKVNHLSKEYLNRLTFLSVKVPHTTTKLSVSEFNEYIERICRWASEFLNIVIPSPNGEIAMLEAWEKSVHEETNIRSEQQF